MHIQTEIMKSAVRGVVARHLAVRKLTPWEAVQLTLDCFGILVAPEADPAAAKTEHSWLQGWTPDEDQMTEWDRQNDQVPAVPVEESVQDDYLVCLEDGQRFKMLKRHLANTYGLTPAQYRARWNLPADYPMVAPAYSRQKGDDAKRLGLGRHLRN